MSRPRNSSKIQIPPRVKGFTPFGYYAAESKPIYLHVEEFESIRLLDYENLSQVEASELMEISRPTLTRIYERARKKVAQALTEANQILIEGGHTFYSSEWKHCNSCDSRFNIVSATNQEKCPLCQDNQITEIRGMNQC